MPENGRVHRLLAEDHDRLDRLLDDVVKTDGTIDVEAYLSFRAGLARHIGMEEKVLFPAARRAGATDELVPFARLRADHGRLVWLLNWLPTPELIGELRALLVPHNALEEAEGGVYASCEALLAGELDALAKELEATPPTPMRPPQARRR